MTKSRPTRDAFKVAQEAREYDSFAAAEKAARRRYARHGEADIWLLAKTPVHGLHVGEPCARLATIVPDADGKLWTDLTLEGCKYA